MANVATVLTQVGRQYRDHKDRDDGAGWWMATLVIVFGLLLLGVIIWAVVTITRSHSAAAELTPPGTTPTAGSSARVILDERFARGEIDVAEYEERRRLLQR